MSTIMNILDRIFKEGMVPEQTLMAEYGAELIGQAINQKLILRVEEAGNPSPGYILTGEGMRKRDEDRLPDDEFKIKDEGFLTKITDDLYIADHPPTEQEIKDIGKEGKDYELVPLDELLMRMAKSNGKEGLKDQCVQMAVSLIMQKGDDLTMDNVFQIKENPQARTTKNGTVCLAIRGLPCDNPHCSTCNLTMMTLDPEYPRKILELLSVRLMQKQTGQFLRKK